MRLIRAGLAWFAIVPLLLVFGCTRNIHTDFNPGKSNLAAVASDAEKTPYVELFQYNRKERPEVKQRPYGIKHRYLRGGKWHWGVKTHIGPHHIRLLEFPSAGDNGQLGNNVKVRFYQSKRPGVKSLVIVLPIYGSYTYPTEEIAAGIRERSGGSTNVAVFLADNFLLDFEGLAEAKSEAEFMRIARQMQQRIITSVIDIQRFIDWAELQPDIDAEHIGLIGFSMSALTASLAALLEPRLNATIITMGAGHPYEVLTVCPGRPGRARDSILNRFNWTTAEYRQRMYEVFRPLDPEIYAGLANPESVLMIDAHYDECMPAKARHSLWKALGYPERVSYLYSHKKAFLSMTPLGFYSMRRNIYRFFDRRLSSSTLLAERSK